MTTRGASNLPMKEGKVLEQQAYTANQDLIAGLLNAERLESWTGGSIDLVSGIDCIATVEQRQVGIALRCRRIDYGSITLNRHITDPYSQVHSLLKTLSDDCHYIAPAFIVQINGLDERHKANGSVIRVNVREFARHLARLNRAGLLEGFWSPRLVAYEFNEESLKGSLSISGFVKFGVDKLGNLTTQYITEYQ
jgi:hypothetical protein